METILLISSVLLWIILIFNLLTTFALVKKINQLFSYPSKQLDLLENGQIAPDFTVETLDGNKVRLNDYNEEIALVFVSPDCSPCKDEMPRLDILYPKARRAGVELSIVSLADADSTRSYVEELEFKAPVLVAPRRQNSLSDHYKIPDTPSYYVIDKNRKIKSGGFLDDNWQMLTNSWES